MQKKRASRKLTNKVSVINFLSKNLPETLENLYEMIEVEETNSYQEKMPVIYIVFSAPDVTITQIDHDYNNQRIGEAAYRYTLKYHNFLRRRKPTWLLKILPSQAPNQLPCLCIIRNNINSRSLIRKDLSYPFATA